MEDNVRLEEIEDLLHNSVMPYVSNVNDGQSLGLLMTHAATITRSVPPINIRGFNFSGRNIEHSRIFANNISSTTEGIRPLIEHAHVQPGISLSTLLNIQRFQSSQSTSSSDNYIIDVEDQPVNSAISHDTTNHDNHHHRQTTATDNFLNNIREAANEVVGERQNNNSNSAINHNNNNNNNTNNNNNNSNNNNIEENSTEAVQISPETRVLLKILQKYITFVCILLAKGIYDHRASILNFIVILITFNHANNVMKREIAKQHNKSWMSLLVITCYIIACIVFIDVEYNINIHSPNTKPLTIWELVWSVLITDFILKLITIICKVVLTCLPAKILTLRKRGKYYLMVEATSQLYRCVAPVRPWLYYFFEAYQGPEKILGVFFSALYTVSKGNDLLSRLKLFYTAIWKLFQNVNLGVSPSKEQLMASGGICAICYEEYSIPVKLYCKHIFCETCVLRWLDRERSCPLCRAAITYDLIYRDGHTTHFIQLY